MKNDQVTEIKLVSWRMMDEFKSLLLWGKKLLCILVVWTHSSSLTRLCQPEFHLLKPPLGYCSHTNAWMLVYHSWVPMAEVVSRSAAFNAITALSFLNLNVFIFRMNESKGQNCSLDTVLASTSRFIELGVAPGYGICSLLCLGLSVASVDIQKRKQTLVKGARWTDSLRGWRESASYAKASVVRLAVWPLPAALLSCRKWRGANWVIW